MFDKFISLGWFCGTASSMSKYGLRSMSGPFDWCFSELNFVLEMIENDFVDFLKKKNLQVHKNNIQYFNDIKYNTLYSHDIDINFELEYEDIYKKYMRRIANFRNVFTGSERICFLRAVRHNEELEYITNNENYVNSVIKKFNPENEIVFLIPKYLSAPESFKFRYYILDLDKYSYENRHRLRVLFDSNEELIAWCNKKIDENVKKDNLIFDLEIELKKTRKDLFITKTRYSLLEKLLTTNFSAIKVPEKFSIYGAGKLGKFLCDKVSGISEVECFIDKNSVDSVYENIPIVKFSNEEINRIKSRIVIVTPIYDIEKIRERFRCIRDDLIVLSLEDVLNNEYCNE